MLSFNRRFYSYSNIQIVSKTPMENELLTGILKNIVLEKVVRDKIIMQQKEQR